MKTKRFTKDEDLLLLAMRSQFPDMSWEEVASHFSCRQPSQCKSRFKALCISTAQNAWTREDDELLVSCVQNFGANWKKISKFLTNHSLYSIKIRYLEMQRCGGAQKMQLEQQQKEEEYQKSISNVLAVPSVENYSTNGPSSPCGIASDYEVGFELLTDFGDDFELPLDIHQPTSNDSFLTPEIPIVHMQTQNSANSITAPFQPICNHKVTKKQENEIEHISSYVPPLNTTPSVPSCSPVIIPFTHSYSEQNDLDRVIEIERKKLIKRSPGSQVLQNSSFSKGEVIHLDFFAGIEITPEE